MSATQAIDGMEMFSVVCVLSSSLVRLYFDDIKSSKACKRSPGSSSRVNKPNYSVNLFKYILVLFRLFVFVFFFLFNCFALGINPPSWQ